MAEAAEFAPRILEQKVIRRFEAKFRKHPETGCWVWTAARNHRGYGFFGYDGKLAAAHRISYRIYVGDITNRLYVLHRCDNPPCVNPGHLFLGSLQDNSDDMVKKGRAASGDRHFTRTLPERIARGEECGTAKLTDDDVRGIKIALKTEETISSISRRFCISRMCIRRIRDGIGWTHVKDNPSLEARKELPGSPGKKETKMTGKKKPDLAPNGVPLVDQIDEITPEMKLEVEATCAKWMALINRNIENGPTDINETDMMAGLKFMYEKVGYKEVPKVEIVDSPLAARDLCKKYGEEVSNMDCLGLGYWAEWHAYYDCFTKWGLRGVADNADLQTLATFLRSGVWDCILFDELAVVSRRPISLKTDEQGRVHCSDGPAIEFKDGFRVYAWHNTWVYPKYVEAPDSLTPDEILKDDNSERIRALAERMGWDRFLAKMDTKVIDTANDERTGLKYELIDFATRRFPLMPRLLKMLSPVLNDGSQPSYIEPVDPGLKSALAARKWQFSKPTANDVTEYWTVEECNNNPMEGAIFQVEA